MRRPPITDLYWALVAGTTTIGVLAVATAPSQALWANPLGAVMLITTAVLLLARVVTRLLDAGQLWRQATRHDSIRADIAAAGGLGRRVAV